MEKVYHRLESPTQTAKDAEKQERSGELWGKAPRFSDIPAVKAYIGPLPEGCAGIEFTTETEPDAGTAPIEAWWRGPREGVEVGGDWAKIRIKVTKNTCH